MSVVASIIVHFVMIPMIVVWWAIAIKRYLCIPRGWLVAPVLALLAIVVFLGLAYLIIPDAVAMDRWLRGDHSAFIDYERALDAEYKEYLRLRREYYAMETRWPNAPFWSRRIEASMQPPPAVLQTDG